MMALFKIDTRFDSWSDGNSRLNVNMDINVDQYNMVGGTFKGGASAELMTKNDDGTVAWHYIDLITTLIQGEVNNRYAYNRGGTYYPSRVYNVFSSVDGVKFVQNGIAPKITYSDSQRMFINLMPIDFALEPTLYLDGTITAEKPHDFTCYTKNIYEDIIIDFAIKSKNKAVYQITQNGKLIKGWTETTERKIVISKGTLKSTDDLRIEVKSIYNFSNHNNAIHSDVVAYTVSGLKSLVAEKPTNFRIVGTERRIEENMLFAWDMVDIQTNKSFIEVWQNGYKVAEAGNITSKQHIMKGGTLKSTDAVELRLYNVASKNGYTATSDVVTLRLNDLKSIKPAIKDFTLDGLNRDYDITVIAEVVGADGYSVNGINGLIVPRGTLNAGEQPIKLVAYAVSSVGVRAESELIKTFTIIQDVPIIYSLEPSDLYINTESDVLVSFSMNEFIDSWKLHFADKVVTGTTERKFLIARGMLPSGVNKLKLEVEYAPSYNSSDKRNAVKEVSFTGYGYPTSPTFAGSGVLNTPNGKITWSTSDASESDIQTAYRVEVLDGLSVVEAVEVDSIVGEHVIGVDLKDNTSYLIKLQIKNKFNMWSKWVERETHTNFNDLPIIDFDLYEANGNVLLKVDIEGKIPPNFSEIKVYRKNLLDKTFKMIADKVFAIDSVIDYGAVSGLECLYKVRLYDNTGAYSETPTKGITVYCDSYQLSQTQDFNKHMTLDFTSMSLSIADDSVSHLFANAEAPVVYEGEADYATLGLNVTIEKERTQELLDILSAGTLLYKDYRHNKYYVNGKVERIETLNYVFNKVSVRLLQVRFNEEGMYSPSELKEVILLDGSSKLDGTSYLRGYK